MYMFVMVWALNAYDCVVRPDLLMTIDFFKHFLGKSSLKKTINPNM